MDALCVNAYNPMRVVFVIQVHRLRVGLPVLIHCLVDVIDHFESDDIPDLQFFIWHPFTDNQRAFRDGRRHRNP